MTVDNNIRYFAVISAIILLCFNAVLSEEHFHTSNTADKDLCFQKCGNLASGSGLQVLDSTNLTQNFLKLEDICDTISAVRKCYAPMRECAIWTNHYEMGIYTAPCLAESRADAILLKPCLEKNGFKIAEECGTVCADHTFDANNIANEEDFQRERDESCASGKCSIRCTMDQISQKCGETSDGRQPSAVFRAFVERVLIAQSKSLNSALEKEASLRPLPPQCYYHLMPELMFDVGKDEAVLSALSKKFRIVATLPLRQ